MIKRKVWSIFQKVKQQQPLIQNITNFVVMPYVANVLLATGASPIMSNIAEEFEDLYQATNAISINIGMLDAVWIENIKKTLNIAKSAKIPVVFDPVASGATRFRTEFAKDVLKDYPISVLRGNPSEILSLDIEQEDTKESASKGVDSAISSDLVLESAKRVAMSYNTIVAMTGQDDYITDGKLVYKLSNGHYLMQKVTGMGCALTSFIACFIAVESDPLVATIAATSIYGVVGTITGEKAKAPGSFQQIFLDVLYTLKKEDFLKNAKILQC